MPEKARKLAEYEVGWWKAHHRKQRDKLIRLMTELYVLQFGITKEQARQAVELRVQATKEHDIAEELEDKSSLLDPQAEVHWLEVESLLRQHFKILLGFCGQK